ncbi:unnamed protein product [Prorocentrum cordatum]|uniref:Subtilisin n=1 Tax=Prorocentrum cordatum TaxID=2364126 RepID=A0ABN9VAP1_9DINO|nr:unnamed protein product [Polarella glacialis]
MTTTRAANLAPCTCSTVPPARGCSSLWRVMGPRTDLFGFSVAVSSDGARVVVGAYYDDGSVHEFDGNTGERLLKLASDGYSYDTFGRSVAVSSDGARVVVGASEDDDQGTRSGSVYVFDGTTGERLLKLVASDGAEGDLFGRSVAASSDGARVVVGASEADNDDGSESGSAYVFDGTIATTRTATSSATSSTTTETTTATTTETTTATTTETTTIKTTTETRPPRRPPRRPRRPLIRARVRPHQTPQPPPSQGK